MLFPRSSVGAVIGDRWGVSEAEAARHYPCDDLVDGPTVQLWRGVTVQAPADAVWPWVRQIRVAPYSYDWVDNAGKLSPRQLVELPDPVAGDPFSRIGGRRDVGTVLSVEPGVQLTASILGAVLSYVLVPQGDSTRLLMKVVFSGLKPVGRVLGLGDWPMARRQLLTLKRLAEQSVTRSHPA